MWKNLARQLFIPVVAILGLFAEGKTKLYNMPQVRYKESDPHSPWKHVGRWRIGAEE